MVTVFHSLNQEQANTFSLVLNASGIGNRVTRSSDGFRIDVPEPYVDSARDVIGRYQAENPATEPDASVSRRHPTFNHFSGIAIALLLLSIHLAVWASSAPEDYLDVFGANARRIVDGEVYRCATALVLHADAAHVGRKHGWDDTFRRSRLRGYRLWCRVADDTGQRNFWQSDECICI